ncbi:hypothetical protein [Gemmatimonas groenlandica]|uniref:Uncharacterized protein n=1 Tax=Gemmatimonas groenlandica TaxID=2732249 RepID=A0A6M4IT34_9BACT|nr:hypothetical protein [Gemmatimonas groenlandica]QJR37375.1 hypothetical protein HKW67_18605 [Gemmatimonas groenlandica]
MTHHSTRWTALLALALGSLTVSSRASAQIAVVSRTAIDDAVHVTFGQLCEDRFVIRNDGTKPVDLEYAVEKGTEHTKLTLGARELVELESKAKEPLELWIGGKLVAKAEKEKRACKDVQGNASVMVAPLEVAATAKDDRNAYARGYPYFDPFMYGGGYGYGGFYGGLGFRPFYTGFVGVPIIVGGPRGGGRRR